MPTASHLSGDHTIDRRQHIHQAPPVGSSARIAPPHRVWHSVMWQHVPATTVW
ncbi:hypothetical protein MWU75_17120 [Ornithinimicrobium sp. F0845]|nr:hypothetical protein [Ornithinimicrobium sp. F0845]